MSFNGKTRFTVELPLDMSREDVDAHVRGLEQTAKYVAGGNIVKVIVVPGKIVNIYTFGSVGVFHQQSPCT